MRPPFVIVSNGDVALCPSQQEAEAHIEAADADDPDLRVFDADGRHFRAVVVKVGWHQETRLSEDVATPPDPEGLRASIVAALNTLRTMHGKGAQLTEIRLAGVPLDELIALLSAAGLTRGQVVWWAKT